MSQVPGMFVHPLPPSSKKAGKNPTFMSVSNMLEQAMRCAVHNASHGALISPTIMKSAGSPKTQRHKVFPYASHQEGANVYAPQPQVSQALMQEYYATDVGPSGYQCSYHSPISNYKLRKDLSAAHIEPPCSIAMPPHHIEITVENILFRAEIFSKSHKRSIVEAILEGFYATNELMERRIQPHKNTRMYLHLLEVYLKKEVPSSATPDVPAPRMTRQVHTEEAYAYEVVTHEDAGIISIQHVLFKQETQSVGPSCTLANDLNIEEAIGQMSASCQASESTKDFDCHMQATQQMVQMECFVLLSVEVQSSSVDMQSMHANPAFMQQEVRGHLMQVGIAAPPADHYVL